MTEEHVNEQPAPQNPGASPNSIFPQGESAYNGPIGLDIGTANVVVARNAGVQGRVETELLQNAFYTLPYSKITHKTLLRDDLPFVRKDDQLCILGEAAEDFANMFGGDTQRPIESGIINAHEHEGVDVIKAIINRLLETAGKSGGRVCFSVPGQPLEASATVVYHESIIKMHLQSLGFTPEPINEGLAIVLAELAETNYTGIGISMGGGMCNVCFSYLSVPVITYSIQKGGDSIDTMVGGSVGEAPTKIKRIKETELDLSIPPRNRIETGLHIYYDDLFNSLVQSLRQVLGSADNIPRLSKAIPLVLSGGSVMPRGSRQRFMTALNTVRLPIRISEIVVTADPLFATAKGALVMATTEEEIL